MASIRLKGFTKITPQSNINDLTPRIVAEDEFVYKDIKFDLAFKTDMSNAADGTAVNTSDLQDLRDEHDVTQALKNIFRTIPGQKILSPYFGLNLAHYCFEPVNSVTADHIARTILIEAPQQDSRLNIKHLTVIGDPDTNRYEIEFVLTLPDVGKSLLNIKGILNSDGFTTE